MLICNRCGATANEVSLRTGATDGGPNFRLCRFVIEEVDPRGKDNFLKPAPDRVGVGAADLCPRCADHVREIVAKAIDDAVNPPRAAKAVG
jgi:hypothetical protein